MIARRAVRDFGVSGDPWPVVDGWASGQGYHTVVQNRDHRVFKKGKGLLVAGARMVDVSKSDGNIHLEAWVAVNGVQRALGLFMLPKEMTIESGGARGALPRKLGRGEVNELLEGLGQQPIAAKPAGSTPDQPSAPPAAWRSDPTTRHQLRYWDGKEWTASVADQGTQSTDPVAV
jgi:hypothetical protein